MRSHIDRFIRSLTPSHAPRTITTYGAILTSFAGFIDVNGAVGSPPDRSAVERFLSRPCRSGSPRSAAGRNQELSALRAFGRFATREFGWPSNPSGGIPFAPEARRTPSILSMGEVRRLFEVATEIARPAARPRALALLAVLTQLGLRVHEAVRLDVEQVDLASATLVGIWGKGGTRHDLPLNAPALALLGAWLAERPRRARAGEQALFVSVRGSRLSIRAVQHFVGRLRLAMGTAKRLSPHTLRHSTATIALTLGTDLATVGELLRHTDLNTTRRYLHLVDTRRREAVLRLAVTVPESILGDRSRSRGEANADRASPPSPPAKAKTPGIPLKNELDVQGGLDAAA